MDVVVDVGNHSETHNFIVRWVAAGMKLPAATLLPEDFKAELDVAHGRDQAGDRSHATRNSGLGWEGDATVCRAYRQEATLRIQRPVWNVELRSIKEIEKLSAELKFHTLREPEVLEHGEVYILEPRAFQNANAGISVMAALGHG